MEAEELRRLLGLLNTESGDMAPGPFAALVREAKAEALVEAKAQLKAMLTEAILQSVLEGLPDVPSKAPPASDEVTPSKKTVADEARTPPPREAEPPLDAAEDEKQRILTEMEAIRHRLGENEERLQRAKSSPSARDEAVVSAPETVSEQATEPLPGEGRGCGYYVYGLLRGAAVPFNGTWPAAGVDPAYPVIAVPHDDIVAAVSMVSLNEFGEQELAANLEDLEWIEQTVRRHEAVLEALMERGPLIPLRFGTIYRDAERVQEMLAQRYQCWVHLLEQLQGRQEWGVKAFLSRESLAQNVGQVSPKVQEIRAQIAQRPSGAAYFAQKKLDEIVAEEVERLGDAYAQDSHDRLVCHSVEMRVNPLQHQEGTSGDEMLLNGAYLVDEAEWPAFHAEIRALEEQYGSLGLTYALTGPWPPYNFVHDREDGEADEPDHF